MSAGRCRECAKIHGKQQLSASCLLCNTRTHITCLKASLAVSGVDFDEALAGDPFNFKCPACVFESSLSDALIEKASVRRQSVLKITSILDGTVSQESLEDASSTLHSVYGLSPEARRDVSNASDFNTSVVHGIPSIDVFNLQTCLSADVDKLLGIIPLLTDLKRDIEILKAANVVVRAQLTDLLAATTTPKVPVVPTPCPPEGVGDLYDGVSRYRVFPQQGTRATSMDVPTEKEWLINLARNGTANVGTPATGICENAAVVSPGCEPDPQIQPLGAPGAEDGFTRVTRKRRGKRPISSTGNKTAGLSVRGTGMDPRTGTGMSTLPTIGKVKTTALFVTRFHPSVSAINIKESINSILKLRYLRCTRLRTKYDSYASFHIEVVDEDFGLISNPEIWPEGCLIAKFYGTLLDNQKYSSTSTAGV